MGPSSRNLGHSPRGFSKPNALMSQTYCVSVRDRSEDLLKIRHTDGFELNGVGALQTRACRGMEVEIL